MRSTGFSQLYQLWISSILFQGACHVGGELAWGFDVLPCRDCGSWNSRLLWLELWFWGKPGFHPQNFFAQVRTVFFDTLNLDLSLFSPCLSTWATAAGLEFFGETLDAEDLMAYLHLLGDSKFGVACNNIALNVDTPCKTCLNSNHKGGEFNVCRSLQLSPEHHSLQVIMKLSCL